MVNIKIMQTNRGYERIQIDNHATTEVCNAISSIGWSLAGGLKNISPEVVFGTFKTLDGDFDIEVYPTNNKLIQAKIDAMFLMAEIGLKQIALKYPQELDVKVGKMI